MVRSIAVLLLGGLLSACAVPLWAQEAILGQTYGNGVHAYFSGEYLRSHQLLTSAINAGSRDPRCYYFRGLAYLRLGRPQEAETDFQQGAKLETADVNKTYSVAKSLERIQGAPRTEVERYRIQARMAALDRSEKERQRRYEENKGLEQQSLEKQADAAPPRAPTTEPIAAPAPTQPENQFGAPEKPGPEPTPKAAPEPVVKPAAESKPKTEPKPDTADPFAGPAKPDAAPAKPATEPAAGPSKAATPDKKHGFGGALKQAIGKALSGDESKPAPAVTEKPEDKPAEKPADKPADKPEAAPDAKPSKPDAKHGGKPLSDDPFADEDKPAKKSGDKEPPAKEPPAKKSDGKKSDEKKPADPGDPFS